MKKTRTMFRTLLALLLAALMLPAECAFADNYAYYQAEEEISSNDGDLGFACRHNANPISKTVKGNCLHYAAQQLICPLCGEILEDYHVDGEDYRRPLYKSHDWGEWEYEGAGCYSAGKRTRTCKRCGETETEKLEALGHYVTDWTVVKAATDFSKGTRSGKCRRCGKELQEDYYPEGTLKPGDRGADVKEMQQALNDAGYPCGNPDGIFGEKTSAAVDDYAMAVLGEDAGGIAWPAVLKKLVGVKVGLELEAQIASAQYPDPGDEVVISWKVTNIGKTPLTGVVLKCMVGNKKIDFYDGGKKVFQTGDFVTGEWKGKLSQATYDTYLPDGGMPFKLVAGGQTKQKESVSSNLVNLLLHLGEGGGENGGEETPELPDEWKAPEEITGMTLVKAVYGGPDNGSFYTAGEEIVYTVKLTNEMGGKVTGIELTDKMPMEYIGLGEPGSDVPYDKDTDISLEDGESVTWTLKHRVTELEAHDKTVSNTAGVTALYNDCLVYLGSNEITCDTGTEPEDGVIFEKYVKSTPKNGSYYTLGETIKYGITFYAADKAVTGLKVTDPLKGENEDAILAMDETVPKGSGLDWEFAYTVTADDVENGEIDNTAYAVWDGHEEILDTVTVKTGGPSCPVKVEKKITNSAGNGKFYTQNEEIEYTVVITNISKRTVKDIYLVDQSSGADGTYLIDAITELAPNASMGYVVKHKVDANDVTKGRVYNQAIVMEDKETPLIYSNITEALTGLKSDYPVLVKTVTSEPANGEYYTAGETVNFVLTLYNIGSFDLKDISIYDILSDKPDKKIGELAELKTATKATIKFDHVVTAPETAAGEIANAGYATFKDDEDQEITVTSNSVKVPTAEQRLIWLEKSDIGAPANGWYYTEGETIHYMLELVNGSDIPIDNVKVFDILINAIDSVSEVPGLGAGDSMKVYADYTVTAQDIGAHYVTNFGWAELTYGDGTILTIVSNDVVSKTGVDKPAESNCCVPELTAYAEGASEYEIAYCDEHQTLEIRTDRARKNGASDEEYEVLAAAWRRAIEKLYSEWMDGLNDTDAAAVAWDRDAFFAAAQAYLDRTGNIEAVVSMYETRCADICYALRSGDKTGAYKKADDAGEMDVMIDAWCGLSAVTKVANDGTVVLNLSDIFDDGHSVTALAAAGQAAEGTSEGWVIAGAIWQTALDRLCNEGFLRTDDAGREMLAADRVAFDEFIAAEREVWPLIYNETITNEIVAREIMDRVMTMCGE